MNKKRQFFLFPLILIVMLLAACGGGDNNSNGASLDEVPIVADDFSVVAEGQIIPVQFVNLSFATGGQVAEILVNEGDEVKAGEVFAHLNNEGLTANVIGAELAVLNAQQALNDLINNADLTSAQASQAVADARDALRNAEIRFNNLNLPSSPEALAEAHAYVVLAEDSLDKARQLYKAHEDKPESNVERAAAYTRLQQAQDSYNSTIRTWNFLNGGTNEINKAQSEADVAYAQALLDRATKDLENLRENLDPGDLALAEASLANAESQLVAAQASLANSELKAPFAGTIVQLNLKIGEQVGPGQMVAVVADMSQWIVETDNLTEIEVPQVSVGQAVTIVPDALSDLTLTGKVDTLSDLFEEKRGDITYTAKIELDESHPDLRWGMIVVVTFEVQE